jgi:hypothetical protein
VNPKDLSRVASLFLLPVCQAWIPAASLTAAHVAYAPSRLPDETPEPAHPPHGEGSGELEIFNGLNASGAMSNAANAVLNFSTWEPPSHGRFEFDRLFAHARLHITSKVTSATPRRPLLPRARRSC